MRLKFLLVLATGILVTSLQAQDYRIENGEVKIVKEILFKTASAELLPESDAALLIIKKYLDDKSYISLLRVETHTDNAGDAAQLLTEQRSLAVCKKLVALGVDCNRILPVGFGNTKPVADNSTPEGKAQNQRTCFFNAALRGKNIGGLPADGGGKAAGDPCN
ncbi:MAG: OmpA family protein [Ferruginibacter sp.]